MHPWVCALLIGSAGAAGGFVSAFIKGDGIVFPKRVRGVWCPGTISTVITGAFAAFASWAFYGSGATIDIAKPTDLPHLQMSALAGAFLVGIVGAKWLTTESEKGLLKESVKVAGTKEKMSAEKAEAVTSGTALEVLHKVSAA